MAAYVYVKKKKKLILTQARKKNGKTPNPSMLDWTETLHKVIK